MGEPDRYAEYARLRVEAPVRYDPKLEAWVLTRYQDIVEVLTDTGRFSAAGSIGIEPFDGFAPEVQAEFARGLERFPGLIEQDPPVHTRYRNLVNLAFTPRRVAALEPGIRGITDRLIDTFILDGHIEFMSGFAFPLPMTVIGGMLGVPDEDLDRVQLMADGFRTLEAGTLWQLPLAEQVSVAGRFADFQLYVADMVEARRVSPADDLVTTLLSAKLGGARDLRTDEIVSTVIHLLFAGQETNARVLGSLMWLVLSERERWLDLVAHTELALEAFEEALRMEPPVTFHARRTIEPVEIGGIVIPSGATVHLVFASANHDETAFDDPERFDPRRANVTRHLGFGRGVHFCVGAPLARLESRVAIERLSRRLPTLRLKPGETARHEAHVMLRGLESLYLEWDP